MNKLKYYVLVVAALVKAFTPSILLFGSAVIYNGTVFGDVLFILGMVSFGWITDIKLPEKSVKD